MIDLLEALHKCAVDLRHIGMLQAAGDYDYLVAWLRSPEFNNGEHLEPHPAGENTIDDYSNNCPIPFTPSNGIVKHCTDRDIAEQLIQSAKDIITGLSDIYTEDIEQIAINEYSDYSDKIIALLKGEEPVPTPPDPPVEVFGEVIKGYFTTAGEAETTDTRISSGGALVYDASGNPLLWESGWNYTAKNSAWGFGFVSLSVLGDGTSGIFYNSNGSPAVGEQVKISIRYEDRHDSRVLFLFRAKAPFYIVYAAPSYKGMQYASKLESGASCSLYPYGTTSRLDFQKLSNLKLVEAFDISGNRQGVDGLSIEQDSSGYAMLVNNRSTQVDPQRLIFTDI